MPFKVREAQHARYVECDPTDFVIRSEGDILDLISACGENETQNVLIYEANFSPDFFDLRTGLAGALFQKFANYHVRGAGVMAVDKVRSERFKELIFECSRGNQFRFFEDRAAAEKWLAEG